MRSEVEIQDRIRQLLQEAFAKQLEDHQEKLPHRCVHNHRQPLDSRRTVNGEPNPNYNRISNKELPVLQTIGLCMYGAENPDDWKGTICEEPIDAQRCPLFESKVPKEILEQEFGEKLKDIEWVRANLPEVNGLLWAISSEQLPEAPAEPVAASEPEAPLVPLEIPPPPPVPSYGSRFWDRIKWVLYLIFG